jgi:hypothetical protein
MRRRIPLLSLLLTATLLVGQWLAAAHDPDHHTLLPGSSHGCVVCVYAHGAGHGALPSVPMLAVSGAIEAPEAAPVATQVAVTVRLHPIRGPPILLA